MAIFVGMEFKFRQQIRELPPSVKFLLYVLKNMGPMSLRDLKEETLLSERTLGYALHVLVEKNLVRRLQGDEILNFLVKRKGRRAKVDKRLSFYCANI